MHFHLFAIGKRLDNWLNAGYEEYAKRFNKPYTWQTHAIAGCPAKNQNPAIIQQLESKQLRDTITNQVKTPYIISLDDKGKQYTTLALSEKIKQWQLLAKPICFVIGGAEGLSKDLINTSDESWSLSLLTFPHPLVRVMVIEQIYRAVSIVLGHPYHRD